MLSGTALIITGIKPTDISFLPLFIDHPLLSDANPLSTITMQLKTLFLAGFVATAAVANGVDTNQRSFCGASVPTEEHLMKANATLEQRTPFNIEERASTIAVIVHVVSVDDTVAGGNVPVCYTESHNT
jgi:hypothetical protein